MHASPAHARAECVPKPLIATTSAQVRRVHVQVLKTATALSVSRASKAAVPFNSGTALLTKAFADLTATTGTPVC
jgi:hypothetical protein